MQFLLLQSFRSKQAGFEKGASDPFGQAGVNDRLPICFAFITTPNCHIQRSNLVLAKPFFEAVADAFFGKFEGRLNQRIFIVSLRRIIIQINRC